MWFRSKKEQVKDKTALDIFRDRVNDINDDIRIFGKFVPIISPIIEKYSEHFSYTQLYCDHVSLSLKSIDNIPSLFCECEKLGIIAIVRAGGWVHDGNYLELRLK